MILDGESELVKSNPAVPCLLTSEENKFFIPGIKNAVNFYIKHFPP